jgi:leucyl aminopeptidase (aminopeptidase T)
MTTANQWPTIAQRIVAGLNVQLGELIQVRDHVDRPDVLHEVLLAVDLAGATPLVDHQSPAYLNRWLATATPDAIHQSSHHRLRWLEQIDRVISLNGGAPNFALATPAALAAWQEMDEALTQIEEARQLPILVVAVPNQQRAERLGMTLAELEAHVSPAHLLNVDESCRLIEQTLAAVAGDHIIIGTGHGHSLHLYRGDRFWHGDDGVIDEWDRLHKTIVSNLPAGSVYTTVLEEKTHGSLFLPSAQGATDVVFHFAAGRITAIDAASGAEQLAAWLDQHGGEPRRVSHIGIGLNPHLHTPIGWTIVDEHIAGALFLALGENRYMGGQNASSLNHDFALHGASLQVDGRVVVGKLTGDG